MNTAVSNQYQKAIAFKSLHESSDILIMPNPWDAGSAKILASMGFKALATTSAGLAYSLGKSDGENAVTRTEALRHARAIAEATDLPVSADLENGYGVDAEVCADTVLLAGEAGLAGCSIEDATGNPENPIHPFALSVERVKAAVKAARSLPYPFMLTARAENFIHGRPDLEDTLRRLEAFAEAGADVLFAPGLKSRKDIETVVKAVAPKPVNVVMGLDNSELSLKILADAGVRRVSLGSSLARAAYGAFKRAAEEIYQKGTFNFVHETIPYSSLNDLLRKAKYP